MINRTNAPKIASLAIPKILDCTKITLNNGIEIFITNDLNQEVFKMDLIFDAGSFYQTQPLIASTTINMLNEGTTTHSAQEIADIFDYYGAYIDYNCGMNKAEISLISLNKYAHQTIEMLSELIHESTLPEKEIEIFLRNKREQFLVNIEKTGYLARKEFTKLLFGAQHPFADTIHESDFLNIQPEQLRDFYKHHFTATGCRIMLSGRIDDTIMTLVEKYFSSMQNNSTSILQPTYPIQPANPGYYKIEKQDAVQASLRIGKHGLRFDETDYPRFQLLNMVLGGYFGSRLMSNIREEKGYTYGINSFNVSMKDGAYWGIATDVNDQYAQATIDESITEIKRLQHELIPSHELTLVKNFFHGELLRELDGVFSQSDTLKHKLNYGFDNNIYKEIIHQIKNCTAHELRDLANKYLNTEEMYYVVVG